MEELHKQVRRAQRRLDLQRFVGVLGWFWFAALVAALTIIVADKYFPLHVQAWIWLSGAIALGLLAAAVRTLADGGRLLEAAHQIDQRFALKERVSSVLCMTPEDKQSAAGQAVTADALKRLKRIDVAEKFTVVPPRKLLLPLAPAFAAIFVILFVNPGAIDNSAAVRPENLETKVQVKKASESIRKQLAQRREQAKKEGLPLAENLFKKLEESAKELAATPPERENALGKLNDLARQLQGRREQFDGAGKVKEQLERLKNVGRGPADTFAQALGKGDLKQAEDELEKLKDQLENGKLTDQQKADLEKQLERMKNKLNRLAEARQAAQDDLQRRAEQMRQAGQVADAEKLEQKLRQSQQQAPQMQPLVNLENKLGQSAQSLKNGDAKETAKALEEIKNNMDNLRRQMEEKQMLDDAAKQLAQAKDQMVCKYCGGEGCENCSSGNSGSGAGRGGGAVLGPETTSDANASFYDSQVKQKVGPGAATVVDVVDGPNVKGNVENNIQQEFDSTRRGSTDPLTGRQIPKKLSQHAREYFDSFREGE